MDHEFVSAFFLREPVDVQIRTGDVSWSAVFVLRASLEARTGQSNKEEIVCQDAPSVVYDFKKVVVINRVAKSLSSDVQLGARGLQQCPRL